MTRLARIALHEYQCTVFKRTFLLALASVPLMMALNIGIGLVIEALQNDDSPVGYVDRAGLFAQPIAAPVSGARKPVEFVAFGAEAAARAALEAGQIQAYYVVAEGYFQSKEVALYYLEEPGRNATSQFYDFLQINLMADQPPEAARRAALLGDGVTVRSLDGRRQVPGGGPTFGIIMPLLIGLGFLVLVLMSSGYLMQAVVEEKENRTMEVLVTSVSPLQLIGGKVLGIVAISLTQLLVWTAVALFAVAIAGQVGIAWFQNPSLDWSAILATLALAIPAYVLTAALMAAVGATVTTAQESQAVGAVFFLLHLSPLWLSWLVIGTPNGAAPVALSFLPFTALMTVVLRNIFVAVPLWQIAVSAAIQTIGAVGAVWLASRAFRTGMLRYGQRLSLREIVAGSRP